ncbi:MAG TPA: carbonic anhydrase [Burkholderiaceae bacterium]|nr:carbonic anhydrase [Burkholderiaceae bacterium]
MTTVELIYQSDGGATATAQDPPKDAAGALQRLNAGNQAFANLFRDIEHGTGSARRVIPINPADLGLSGASGAAAVQRPFAAVLGCADARVPVELIFGEGPNDLFVVRVAGNTLGDDVHGSLRYALDHLGDSLKLVVVLGHSGCGAVTAAVDVFLDPAGYLSLTARHSIRNLVDRLQVVVGASARRLADAFGEGVVREPGYREALIEVAVVSNAALGAHTLLRETVGDTAQSVEVAYGVYLLDQRFVWAPRAGSDEVIGLATPPRDGPAFAEFSVAVMQSERIRAILGRPLHVARNALRK